MGQILYERPREKLHRAGVRSLSLLELLQLIIGAGTQGVSAARLARDVSLLIQKPEPISVNILEEIPGIGPAKACQILAAIELGARVDVHTR